MPAKVKVTKEMILDAAFAVARETGAENISARTVSERLHCSTQPVMYHFATIEELKRAVYDEDQKAAEGRCAWNWNELYSFCNRRAAFVPVPVPVGLL